MPPTAVGETPAGPEPERAPEAHSLPNNPEGLGRALEACRPYLLSVANRELDTDLAAKAGASDLVQETLMQAQLGLGHFQGRTEAELRGWLRRILRHNLAHLVRYYRQTLKRKSAREISIDRDPDAEALKDNLAASNTSPSGEAIRHEELDRVHRALARLSERDRQVILWRSRDYRPWDDIGRRLGTTPEAAKRAWSRALGRLRAQLGDEQPPG
jgi:RNA polymerase sigma-70 factor (ECF subfamily)